MVYGMSTQGKKAGCLKMIVAAVILLSLMANFILFIMLIASSSANLPDDTARPVQFREVLLDEGTSEEAKVAAIPLTGLIAFEVEGASGKSMVTEFVAAVRKATRNDEVKAILLLVNSGGGEVTASDELYAAVKEAAAKKPVLVYMLAVGASGAYYTAVGGTEIMASDTCFTGSIGVILKTLNYEGLFDKVGLSTVTFKSGAFKDMLAGDRELTPEEIEYVQEMIMQIYDKFVGIVATERSLNLATLKEGVADGRVLSGLDAKEAGLIDATGRLDDAFARVREMAGDENAPIVQYTPERSLGSLFKFLTAGEAPKIEIEVNGLPSNRLEPGRFYLLPATFATQP